MNDIQMTQGGDIAISAYDILTTNSIEQAILIKLRWFFGEWVYNEDFGVDWFGKVLIKNPNSLTIKRMIEDTIMSVDGVTGVEDMTLSVDRAARNAKLAFTVHTIDGTDDYIESDLFTDAADTLTAWYAGDGVVCIKGPSYMVHYKDDAVTFSKYVDNVHMDDDALVLEVTN